MQSQTEVQDTTEEEQQLHEFSSADSGLFTDDEIIVDNGIHSIFPSVLSEELVFFDTQNVICEDIVSTAHGTKDDYLNE